MLILNMANAANNDLQCNLGDKKNLLERFKDNGFLYCSHFRHTEHVLLVKPIIRGLVGLKRGELTQLVSDRIN